MMTHNTHITSFRLDRLMRLFSIFEQQILKWIVMKFFVLKVQTHIEQHEPHCIKTIMDLII